MSHTMTRRLPMTITAPWSGTRKTITGLFSRYYVSVTGLGFAIINNN